MLKKVSDTRKQISFFSLEDLVPEEHLVRKLDKAIDFNFVYDEVKDLYSDVGRGSIDPVSLIKIVLVQYMFGIKSMRQTIKDIEVNMAYRWFCGFGLTDSVPHFSTFGKNYMRRFKDSDIFEKIFNRILTEAIDNGFVDTSAIYIDSTHIKASANKKKKIEVFVQKQTKSYQKTLEKEINEDRVKNGKKEFDDDDDDSEIKITKSTTDPDAGDFHKGEHEQQFAYSAHTACDKKGFILDHTTTPANVHDSTEFDRLYQRLKNNFHFTYIGLDAGYKTPAIAKEILDDNKIPLMPYTRHKKKQEMRFEYNSYYDFYTCPNGNILEHSTTNRLGYKQYTSNSDMCKTCPNYEQCISQSQKNRKVFRHLWQDYIDRVESIRHTEVWKELYPKRAENIERVFGDAKEKHGMRYTQLRGLKKVDLQILLTFSCMNLKKLATWKWKNSKILNGISNFFKKIYKKLKSIFENFSIFLQKSKLA